jgi:hypothetical protein
MVQPFISSVGLVGMPQQAALAPQAPKSAEADRKALLASSMAPEAGEKREIEQGPKKEVQEELLGKREISNEEDEKETKATESNVKNDDVVEKVRRFLIFRE